MIETLAFRPEHTDIWDECVRSSRNGTFLFERAFMDYHADRFEDASLLFRRKGKLLAVLPQSVHDSTREWRSHGGLTYGGLVLAPATNALDVLAIFDLIADEARRRGVARQLYKPVPAPYHRGPAEEDLYALFRCDAKKIVSQVDSVIDLERRAPVSSLRRRKMRQARREGLVVVRLDDPGEFHEILAANLRERHDAKPVHTGSEMRLLESRFPEAIRTWGVRDSAGTLVAGCWIFDTGPCIHAQYIASTSRGRHTGALDLLFPHLIEIAKSTARWFSFGTSNDPAGHELNDGLVRYKISYGARAFVYDTYRRDFARDADT